MNDGNVPTLDFEDYDFSDADRFVLIIGEEQKVPPVEGWLHTPTASANDMRISFSGSIRKLRKQVAILSQDCVMCVVRVFEVRLGSVSGIHT